MICRTCSVDKAPHEFRKKFDGKYTYYEKQCRSCNDVQHREWEKRNPDKLSAQKRRYALKNALQIKVRDRTRYRKPERRERIITDAKRRLFAEGSVKRLERLWRWRNKNPEKYAAQTYLNNALKREEITKGACSGCGSTSRINGHHHDYSRPLDVTWLCPSCHGVEHAKINMTILCAKIAQQGALHGR